MRPSPRPPRGQALALALLLLAVVAAGLMQAFDGGRLLRGKTRLASAADAAAYSGALAQARALNFLAYANRALVAHQVAMAHAITLAAWARFGGAQARQLAIGNPPATLIGGFFGPAQGAAYMAAAAARGMESHAQWGSGDLARAYAEHDRVVHDILARAQEQVMAGMASLRGATMRAVLAAQDESGATALAEPLLADALPGFLARRGGDDRARLKSLVVSAAGRYGFLAPRDDTARSLLPVDPRCPWLRHELRRRGSTVLEGFDAWRAIDTESFHALRSNPWIGCYRREYPMAYGAAQTRDGAPQGTAYTDAPPANFADQDFWRWVAQATDWDILGGSANPLANSYALAQGVRWAGRGLPGYVELAHPGLAGRDTAPLRFAIQVRAAGMTAVSAAESYYRRPAARGDGRTEGASLFMPYWQARLSPVADAERARAWRATP